MIMIDIEELIPHRDRMKLIDRIIEVDDETALTESVVTREWPLYDGNSVNSIILIELAAQTAGINIGWTEKKKDGENADNKGWIVGIKNASFHADKIPLNSRIITRSRNRFIFDNFREILGTAKIDEKLVGEIILQVFWQD